MYKNQLKICSYEDIKFFLGVAEVLPFPAGKFDVVFVDSVFHHFLRVEKVLSEIKRVLKSKGLLCFVEPNQSIPKVNLSLFLGREENIT